MRLKDKIALITGAGTGIGDAIAHKFAREGARLVLNGLADDPVQDVAAAIVAGGGACSRSIWEYIRTWSGAGLWDSAINALTSLCAGEQCRYLHCSMPRPTITVLRISTAPCGTISAPPSS